MKNKGNISISIAIILLLIPIIYTIQSKKASVDDKSINTDLYTIPVRKKIFVNGIIEPEKIEKIFLDDTNKKVDKIFITKGQTVKKGTKLFTYKNSQITEQINELNKQIQQIKLQSNNTKDTSEDFNSKKELNFLKNQVNTLKTKEFSTITAPLAGKVILNDSIKDSSKPFIIIESTTFYVKGSISEKDRLDIKMNNKTDILVFSTNKVLPGKIKTIGNKPISQEPPTNEKTASENIGNMSYYNIGISLNSQKNILNGFHVQATIYLTDGEIKIPKTSILKEKGKNYVFKVVNNDLVKQEITCKKFKNTSSEVIVSKGLKENDSIVKNTKDVKEGTVVE